MPFSHFFSSFFSVTLAAILFLVVQTILLVAWIGVYYKHRSLKKSNDISFANEIYRDFDPYLSTIFRKTGIIGNRGNRERKQESPVSSPETSLDLVQRKLILSHIDDKKQRRNI